MDTGSSYLAYSWENIRVSVDDNQTTKGNVKKQPIVKEILKNVSGIAQPGELLAIMGASGAGKTSLLDVLKFQSEHRVSGSLKINGEEITSPDALSFIVAHVTQHDSFIATLTVMEHLLFNAKLRLPKAMRHEDRLKRIEEVMSDFNLKNSENTIIGDPLKGLKGLSSGEKRRLAVATELLKNAKILIADEPTTGLDSFMAVTMIECLKNQARKGKTIICTIHQPSSSIFRMFDKLYLLAESRLAFYGTLNEASDFFTSQKLIRPNKCNPAEFYTQTLAIQSTTRDECLELVNKICDNFSSSVYQTVLNSRIKETSALATTTLSVALKNQKYSASMSTQIGCLIWRNILQTKRNKSLIYLRLFQVFYFPVFYGLVFLNQNIHTEDSIRNINGVLFANLLNLNLGFTFQAFSAFSSETPIVFREHTNGLYTICSYLFSKIISEFPFNCLLCTVHITIVYLMANLNNQIESYLLTIVIFVIMVNIAYTFGAMVATIVPTIGIGMKIINVGFLVFACFGGLYAKIDTIPSILQWMRYVIWLSYTNEALLISQWKGIDRISCNANSTICSSTSGGALNGNMVLELFNMKEKNLYFDISMLAVILLVFCIFIYLALVQKKWRQKLRK